MRAPLLVIVAVDCLLFSGCSPLVDAEFHNATGQAIIVTNVAQPAFHASIPPGASAPVDVLVLRSGHPEEFTIAAGRRLWRLTGTTRFSSVASVPSTGSVALSNLVVFMCA